MRKQRIPLRALPVFAHSTLRTFMILELVNYCTWRGAGEEQEAEVVGGAADVAHLPVGHDERMKGLALSSD